MMAGATVEYEASPMPTRPRKKRNHQKLVMKDPSSVAAHQNEMPTPIRRVRLYLEGYMFVTTVTFV